MRKSVICLIYSTSIAFTLVASSVSGPCDDTTTDCTKKASMCSNRKFDTLMRSYCKRTCGFCNDATEGGDYFEQIEGGGDEEETEPEGEEGNEGDGEEEGENPDGEDEYTEGPDAEEETTETTDEYETEEEEVTDSGTDYTMSSYSTRKMDACVDVASDCAMKTDLCQSPMYRDFMSKTCRRSCKMCNSGGDGVSALPLPTAPPSLVSLLNCHDTSADCKRNVQYCYHPEYAKLMSEKCQKSCKMC